MKLGEVHRGYEFQRVAEESRHGGGENVNDASDKRSDLPESIVFQLSAGRQDKKIYYKKNQKET